MHNVPNQTHPGFSSHFSRPPFKPHTNVKLGEIETSSWRGLWRDDMKHDNSYRHEEALPFYSTVAWQNCRKAYAASQAHLCERCYSRGIIRRGEIVHHIQPLNSQNIHDPAVTLNYDNLMLVCRQCHGEIHAKKRFRVGKDGKILALDTLP